MTATINDGLTVTTPPLTTSRAIDTAQSGPTTGTVAGPLIYNQIAINSNCKPTTDTRTMGLYMQFNSGGATEEGGVYPLFINLNHNAASDLAGDHVAIVGQTYSNVADGGGGELYGMNGVCYADTGAATPGVNGAEFDVKIMSGATVTRRSGVRVINEGNSTASGHDAAYAAMSTVAGGGFKSLLLLTTWMGQAPLQSTGAILTVEGAQTIANVLDLTNLTVTGNIINHPNAVISGAGAALFRGALTLASATPEIVLYESDAPADAKYWDFYASGGDLKLDTLNDSFTGRANRLTIARTRPTVTGSRGGNAALASLLTALSGIGLITDSTTA